MNIRCSTGTCWVGVLLGLALLGGCGGKKAPERPMELGVPSKIRLAQAHVQGGRVAEALSLLQQAVAEDSDNAALQNFYGQVCFLAGRHEQAEQAYLKALELDPYLTDAHNNLGALYDRIGRKDAAEREFLLALDDLAYPTPQKVHLNLGILYQSQGRIEETIQSFRRAVEIDPKYYQAHFELASVLDQSGELEEAVREYEVAEPAYRDSGDYHLRLGFTYLRLGHQQKAKQHLTRVREVAPGSSDAVRADELLKMME